MRSSFSPMITICLCLSLPLQISTSTIAMRSEWVSTTLWVRGPPAHHRKYLLERLVSLECLLSGITFSCISRGFSSLNAKGLSFGWNCRDAALPISKPHSSINKKEASNRWSASPKQVHGVFRDSQLSQSKSVLASPFSFQSITAWTFSLLFPLFPLVPTAAPQNVVIQSATATQLDIAWDPPPPEAQNGDIQGYKVSDNGKNDWGYVQMLIENICPAENGGCCISWHHHITILQYNRAGSGEVAYKFSE